jgi:CHAP domain
MSSHPCLLVSPHAPGDFPRRKSGMAAHSRWRAYFWLCSLLFLIGGLWGSSGARVAHASISSNPFALGYRTASGEAEKPPLQFYNAANVYMPFVQHHPKVYLVFWGPNWSSDADTRATIVNTFKALAGTAYNNILTQYNDGADYVHNDVSVQANILDSSTPPSSLDIGYESNAGVWNNAQIRHEADMEIANNHWAVNRDSQVIVFPQKGSTYWHGSGWCGAHSYNSTAASPYAYAEIQYGDQYPGCDFVGNYAKDITWSAVHEYTETATDPVIYGTLGTSCWPPFAGLASGWHTVDSSKCTPQEIADLCSGYSPNYNNVGDFATINGVSLPYLWSNSDPGCESAGIVSIAHQNLGMKACSTNSAGGTGYYTSCTGNGGQPEFWCSDFARWVWAQAGRDTVGLNAESGSFGLYGPLHSTPHLGDAALFNYNGNGNADHVALVVQVNSNGTIVTIGGDENGVEGPTWARTASVVKDGPYSSALGYSSAMGMTISGYVSPQGSGVGAGGVGGGSVVPAPPGGATPPSGAAFPTAKWWVTTFASAPGYGGGWRRVGTLYAGTNYVFCKDWGAQISDSVGNYNHWWLWTDLDTGGQGWVSAYYLSKWGNDVAKDNAGTVIPNC